MPNIQTETLVHYLNDYLAIDQFSDYAPNGLQVQGSKTISKIVTGVTACQALIDKAIMLKADAILVHHGYFWKGEQPEITGMKYKRLKSLLENDINLLAYHLPLDAHMDVGNNIGLARKMNWEVTGHLEMDCSPSIGFVGRLSKPCPPHELETALSKTLNQPALHIAADKDMIETIAWCTGGAQRAIDYAVKAGVDAYISGEISENTVHTAREMNIHYYAAGHHATERFGVKLLGKHLHETFDLDVQFVDIFSPA